MNKVEILASHAKAAGIEDFHAAVSAYIDAMHAHRFTVDTPAPMAPHYLVEHAVKRVQSPVEAETPDDFVPNYELIDDVTLTLAQKKDALENQVHASAREWAAKNTIHHRRLGMLAHTASPAFAAPSALVTSTQAAAIATMEENSKKLAVIQAYVAKQLDDIEDLTDANVDAWKPELLPAP